MTSVSAGHIIPTPTQPVGSGRLQRESNAEESRALLTELPRPQFMLETIIRYAEVKLYLTLLKPTQSSSEFRVRRFDSKADKN